jgi:hypothetical protein
MRGFKQAASADLLARGHALIQNLRNGFSTLTTDVAQSMRLATAWEQLIQIIQPCTPIVPPYVSQLPRICYHCPYSCNKTG